MKRSGILLNRNRDQKRRPKHNNTGLAFEKKNFVLCYLQFIRYTSFEFIAVYN